MHKREDKGGGSKEVSKMNIVVDTNIIMSALIKESTTRKLILKSEHKLLLPALVIDELREHKEEILQKSGLNEQEYDRLTSILLKYVEIVPTEEVLPYKEEAIQIIGSIDEKDALFIATALAFNATVWSDDKHFKEQNAVKAVTTRELIDSEL